ncbi:DUF2333 family protein [Meridianimarinicoccus sp. RP-17]|uniref:DUF2333 family protein n=1 Tax=Meridianimarinicoccus zhengii TaxID=2056810 RepID=UPI000DADDA49|nr:DUF2333 family protein [Phycocomes zhengii]
MPNDAIASPSSLPVPQPRRRVARAILGKKPATVALRGSVILAVLFAGYFGVVGNLMNRVDANPDFAPTEAPEAGSAAVAMAAALIRRETVDHRWSVNDPAFFPTAFHDNMPNFQNGVLRGVSRFVMALESQIGRTRGSSAIDANLGRAVGLLQYPSDVWMFDFRQSMFPVSPSDQQYRAALEALEAYNARVAQGGAVFERRTDTFALTLQAMAAELGARTAEVDEHLRRESFIIDGRTDDIFYFNKGQVYASYLLLREMGRDFEAVISQQGLTGVYDQALDSLRTAASQRPLVVLNAAGDDSIFANHLYLQGFYIKRAILQLDEVSRVLSVSR